MLDFLAWVSVQYTIINSQQLYHDLSVELKDSSQQPPTEQQFTYESSIKYNITNGNKLNCFISAKEMLSIMFHCAFFVDSDMLINYLLKKMTHDAEIM